MKTMNSIHRDSARSHGKGPSRVLQWDQAGHTRGIDKQPAVLAAHLHVLALDALLSKLCLIPIDSPLNGGAEGIGPCHMELFCLVSSWLSRGRSAGHLLYHHCLMFATLPYLSLLQGLRLPSSGACSLVALAVQSVPIWARGFLDAGSSDFDSRRRSSPALRHQ